ncbi:hypothetical protein PV08_06950 [Exophiala spinifera]|uniref:NmrA-like domain-containing protein n=1 Tax=Exophiala spinifera TaxID=91928 RepID=A0A0D2BSF1_9EURO|nr:uncharacterized protein PV08_06950 [Exophiala spinifera]KIW14169.1 hypothetical protein PV08_06950 [Exophiala spinifera]
MSPAAVIKNVVLIGAGGNLGSMILSALLASKEFKVTVLTRPTSTATFPADLSVIRASYTEDELVKAFHGQDAVVSAVGAMGFADQKVFIDAAIKAGVKRFLPAEYSSNTLSEAVRELVPVFEAKKVILDYLKQNEKTGLTWTGLAVGPLLDWGLANGFFGFDIANKTAEIWDGGNVPFSATNRADFGRAVASTLKHPAETANQFLYVATVTTTQKDILKAFEAASGQKWTVRDVKTDDQIATGRKMVSEGDFNGMLTLVRASAWGTYLGIRTNYPVDEKLANAVLEIPNGSLDDTVKAVLSSA